MELLRNVRCRRKLKHLALLEGRKRYKATLISGALSARMKTVSINNVRRMQHATQESKGKQGKFA